MGKINMDIQMAEMKKDITYIKDSIIDNKKEHTELFNLIRDFRDEIKQDFKEHSENYDKKYASKFIEKLVWIVLGGLATAIATYLMSLL